MNNPLGVSPSKGKQGTTWGKEKIFWPRWEPSPWPPDQIHRHSADWATRSHRESRGRFKMGDRGEKKVRVHMNVVPRSWEHKYWNRELTRKCKLKCYLNPWITHWVLALVKGNRSWVRFPPESKDFFFASCVSLFPFSTRANAQCYSWWSKFYPLIFYVYQIEFHERIKTQFTVCKYLHWFRRYLSLKNVQNMQMRWLVTSYTQPNIISSA